MPDLNSPGAIAIRESLVPDIERLMSIASRLTQAQGRALALAHEGPVQVSNQWGGRTIPAAAAKSLLEFGLLETVSTGFGERSQLTRDGKALIRAVIKDDRDG